MKWLKVLEPMNNNNFCSDIIDKMTDAIVVIDQEWNIVGSNQAFDALTGVSIEQKSSPKHYCDICQGVVTKNRNRSCEECYLMERCEYPIKIKMNRKDGKLETVTATYFTHECKQNQTCRVINLRQLSKIEKEKEHKLDQIWNIYEQYSGKDSLRKAFSLSNRLTKRETEIVSLIAIGCSNKEISVKLTIAVKTVEKHKSNIVEKLQLKSNFQLTRYAIMHKLVEFI